MNLLKKIFVNNDSSLVTVSAGNPISDPQAKWEYGTSEYLINQKFAIKDAEIDDKIEEQDELISGYDQRINLLQNDMIELGDKAYDASTYSGLGRKLLKKNMVSGVNTLYQEDINEANTIYVILYDYVLGENITVPENCVLDFEGGSINGNNYTYKLAGLPRVIAGDEHIFRNVILDINYVESEWIGVFQYGDSDYSADSLQGFLNNHVPYDPVYGNKIVVHFKHKTHYNFGHTIIIPKGSVVSFEGVVPNQDYLTRLQARFSEGTFIKVYGNFTAENIQFAANSNDIVIDYKRSDEALPDESVNDTDGLLYNCSIQNGEVGVRLTGRLTRIDRCGFGGCSTGVLIEDLLTTGNYGSGRNNLIVNCHFHHGMGTYCIVCTGTALRNITIDNNNSDVANAGCFLKGNFKYGRITNNLVHITCAYNFLKPENRPEHPWIFDLNDVSNTLIQGNKLDYLGDVPYGKTENMLPSDFEHFIVVHGDAENVDIIDNKFGTCTYEGFVFEGNVNNVNICNNSIFNVCTNVSYNKSYKSKTASLIFAYIVKFADNKTISNVRIEDNSLSDFTVPAKEIFGISSNIRSNYSDINIFETSKMISTYLYSNSLYRIGEMSSSEAGGGAFIIAGRAINEFSPGISYLTIGAWNNGVVCNHIELEGTSRGTLYIDNDKKYIYWMTPVGINRNTLSIIPCGYGIKFNYPILVEDVNVNTLTACTKHRSGGTNDRPIFGNNDGTYKVGYMYFDTSLNKSIWWTGDTTLGWVDATGTSV